MDPFRRRHSALRTVPSSVMLVELAEKFPPFAHFKTPSSLVMQSFRLIADGT